MAPHDNKISTDVSHLEHRFENPPSQTLDAEEELVAIEKEEKMTGYVLWLAIVASVAGLLFGYDTGIISVALPNLNDDLGHTLSHVESEWITSSLSVGALIGALGGGSGADRIGRRLVLLIGDIWFILGAVVICAAYSVPQMIVGRIFLGFGVGIASSVAPVFIGEVAPTRFRGTLISVQSFAIVVGQFIAYLFGMAFSMPQGWRGMFGIAILPALFQAVAIHWLPESPRYEMIKGNDEKARQTLAGIYKRPVDDRFIELKVASIAEVVEITQGFRRDHTFLQTLAYIARHPPIRRPIGVAIGLGLFQQLSGWNTIMYYAGTIFSYVGFDDPAKTGLIIAGANCFFTGLSMLIIDRVGRRTILMIGYPLAILGLILASIAFTKMTGSVNGQLVPGAEYDPKWANMMLGAIVIFISGFSTSLGTIAWTAPELMSLQVRGVGASLFCAASWSGNIIIASTFLSIMAGIGAAGAYFFYAGICACGYVFILFCYPEVTGLSLEEIEHVFSTGFGIRKAYAVRREHKAAAKHRAQVQAARADGSDSMVAQEAEKA